MKLNTVAQLLGYTLEKQGDDDVEFSMDTRTLKSGSIFIALKGESFDGHDFIGEAFLKGAAGVICERPHPDKTLLQFVVEDSLQALGMLATFHRQTITCPVIALTGSNGKTTVKEMIAAILPKPSLATKGNLNNHIGVPLNLLNLQKMHKYAVFELGANHIGEIAYTAAMVKPDVALVNNVAPAHVGVFGSVANIAKTKGEIYESLGQTGIAVVNEDDDYAHFWDPLLAGRQVKRFSLTKPVDAFAKDLSWNKSCAEFTLCLKNGEERVSLKVPGMHSIQNALAAALCCEASGIAFSQIIDGLNQFTGVSGRLNYLSGKNQSIIIDDTYNANLRSVLAAVAVLANHRGRRILVLGDMGELGEWTEEHHQEVGRVALSSGIDLLLTCGQHSLLASNAFGGAAKHYDNKDSLAQDLLTYLDNNTVVLVKGSRSAGMEKIVHQLVS